MAHFAEIDQNNIVLRVLVVANSEITDANGVEQEKLGADFFHNLLGGTWVQTSYNDSMRKNYAGVGFTYDSGRDAFIPPKPYPSWLLVEESCQWAAPTPCPEPADEYEWDEQSLSWVKRAGGA